MEQADRAGDARAVDVGAIAAAGVDHHMHVRRGVPVQRGMLLRDEAVLERNRGRRATTDRDQAALRVTPDRRDLLASATDEGRDIGSRGRRLLRCRLILREGRQPLADAVPSSWGRGGRQATKRRSHAVLSSNDHQRSADDRVTDAGGNCLDERL